MTFGEKYGEVHDFYGPYQIHTHPDGDLVFIKNGAGHGGVYSMTSEKLMDRVKGKIAEHEQELMKWNLLLDRINNG